MLWFKLKCWRRGGCRGHVGLCHPTPYLQPLNNLAKSCDQYGAISLLQPLLGFPINQQDLVSYQLEFMSLKKCGFRDPSYRDWLIPPGHSDQLPSGEQEPVGRGAAVRPSKCIPRKSRQLTQSLLSSAFSSLPIILPSMNSTYLWWSCGGEEREPLESSTRAKLFIVILFCIFSCSSFRGWF